ncbi:hypothetical protein Pla22_42410 [Rubripirellula amarantea]|uniref:HEAT repeat protein n=1 Tax=Rubripirellula amarantea TaxID=2527999 RepID=A0A5C5WN86_9BACT|nr:hypothetical protein Pla22_42410 [Rubripirellula amarantea]
MCREIDLDGDIDKRDYGFLLAAVRSIGCVICDSGFEASDALHQDFLEWTLNLTDRSDNELCAIATWALGDLGVPPEVVRTRLTELLQSTRRKADHELTTCRSIAFRMLAKVDRKAASDFVSSDACKEYLASMDHWLTEYPNNLERRAELLAEVAWLHNNEDR